MIFGNVATEDAEGCLLAHSLRLAAGRVRKGTVLSADIIQRLHSENVTHVVVARLQENDVHEDTAATQLALALAGNGVTLGKAGTGRVNCYAKWNGCLLYTSPSPRDRTRSRMPSSA